MARLQGISGGLSGKTGSYTFRQSRGQTIVSQYQPVVKNPNTQGQQNQRARFKLMSQLAAVMSAGFGTMGVTKRAGKAAPTQRNAFIQLNMPLVEVESQDNSVTAKIPMDKVKLTSSYRPLGTLSVDAAVNTVDVSVATVSMEIKSVRMILVGYDTLSGVSQPIIKQMVDVPVESSEAAYSFTGLVGASQPFTVLAFGLIPSESESIKTRLDNIHTSADENFIAALELNQLVSQGEMAETITVGQNFTLATV